MLIDSFLSWLWRASWQASVLVAIVFVAQRLLRSKLSPAWNYALWFLVVARLCLPVSPPSALSVFNYARVDRSGDRELPSWLRLEDSVWSDEAQRPSAGNAVAPGQAALSVGKREAGGANPGLSGLPSRSSESSWARARRILAWVWLAGFSVIAARLAAGDWRFDRRLRRCHPLKDAAVLSVLEACKTAMGVGRRIDLIETPDVDSPALFGCFRLRLLLPDGLAARFSRDELRHVFLHELAHVRRGDVWVNWLTTFLQALHWFNPALWFGFSRMRTDREVACDALALSFAREGESQSYGETIIKLLAGLDRPALLPGMIGILEDKRQMKRRIAMIAKFKRPARWSALVVLPMILLGLITLTDAQTKRERADKETIAEIERFEGKITYDETRPDRPVISVSFYNEDRWSYPAERQITDDMLKRLGSLKDLENLDVRNGRITDDGLAHLAGLTKLKALKLEWTKIKGAGLPFLKAASSLSELHLQWTDCDDAGLANLRHFPNLETLTLGPPEPKVKITDAGLKHLSGLQKLRVLRIRGFRQSLPLTEAGFAHLRDLKNLEVFTLAGKVLTDPFGDESLAHLKGWTKLKHLDLRDTLITDSSFDTLKNFPNLRYLAISGTLIRDAGLANLKHFQQLEELRLGWATAGGSRQGQRYVPQVTDAVIEQFKSLPKLRRVVLERPGPGLTDAGLKTLGDLHLEVLQPENSSSAALFLVGPGITDSGLIHLKELAKLDGLSLNNTQVTDAGLMHLKDIPGLEKLDIGGTQSRLTDAGLAQLKAIPGLTKLSLNGFTNAWVYLKDLPNLRDLSLRSDSPPRTTPSIPDTGLVHLKEMTKLKKLFLTGIQVSDGGVAHLKQMTNLETLIFAAEDISDAGLVHLCDMTKLKELYLDGSKVTDAGLPSLARLRALNSLDLSRTKVTDAGMEHLSRLPRLQYLYLADTQVTDNGLQQLKGIKGLSYLSLKGTKVTGAGIDSLNKALPELEVSQ